MTAAMEVETKTMKQRIEIRNFGPIKHVDLDIADFTLFIGPNASGKSTIAKLVWFCQVVIQTLTNRAVELVIYGKQGPLPSDGILAVADLLFKNIWDAEVLQDDFEVHLYSTSQETEEQRIVSIRKHPKEKNKVQFDCNDDMMNQIDEFVKWVEYLSGESPQCQKNSTVFGFVPAKASSELVKLLQKFGCGNALMFIPAGRQAFAIPKDERQSLSSDYFMKEFYEHTKEQKKQFRKPISQKLKDKREEYSANKQLECLELAQDLISKILKGKYVSPRDDERIYFDKEQYVKLYEASSGQQEALWILNSIFSSIELQQDIFTVIEDRFTVIEEPEAHLYPETQKTITELISLLANQRGNQVMITTHSPYILSALNNLLYAHKVGKTKPDEVAGVIDPLLWVDIDRVAAYKVEDGTIRNIVDRRTSDNLNGLDMIIPEEIDALPHDPIVEDYTRLFNLDDCNDAD